jgi:hypothetical protein
MNLDGLDNYANQHEGLESYGGGFFNGGGQEGGGMADLFYNIANKNNGNARPNNTLMLNNILMAQ